MKRTILIISLFCFCCHNQKIQKNVEISFISESNISNEKFNEFNLIFTTGFDSLEYFKIFSNDILIKDFNCKTDYTSGISFLGNKHDSPASFIISYKQFHDNNYLKIENEKECFKIFINEEFKKYNSLYISKENNKWFASFEKSSEIQIFE